MDAEKDLLFALLALQLKFVSKDRLVECGARWASDRAKSLRDLLVERAALDPEVQAALDALVEARVRIAGDSDTSLLDLNPDDDVHHSLLELPLDPITRASLSQAKSSAPPRRSATVRLNEPLDERYRLGREIGRGGLGLVVAARDRALGRDVAVKKMIRNLDDASLLRRFVREGEVAARLMHPNIVPVYDIGVRDEGGKEVPYFVMGRIDGKDLREILLALRTGEEAVVREFSRSRLLRIFQDVCLAMAYAHDRGVVHRDLKPANVMVGNYGEVYVVDWGLAKVQGQEDTGPGAGTSGAAEAGDVDGKTQLTVDGDILGTPQYMSPEQAAGRVSEIDERSDIFSLGAILYEILTFEPPFTGSGALEVLSRTLTHALTPPSFRVARPEPSERPAGARLPAASAVHVPPELDEIAMKALSREKENRYGSAREIHRDVQAFLDGEKEKERNRRMAAENVARGEAHVASLNRLRAEVKSLEGDLEARNASLSPHSPLVEKRKIWSLQEKIEASGRAIVRTFGEAEAGFLEALGFERDNPKARSALADLYWTQFLVEEEDGDEGQALYFDGLVRKYNDGQFDAPLKGDGNLTLKTCFRPCRCLLEGRSTSPEEMNVMGFHPGSGGTSPQTKEGQAASPGPSTTCKVHGPSCKLHPLTGAEAWLFAHEARDKRLVPVFPHGVDWPGARRAVVPDDTLDLCFDPSSPFRPAEGLRLGRTPLDRSPLPMGSYLLILHKEGYQPLRVPIHVARFADVDVEVTMHEVREVPDGFIPVPEGPFVYQGDRGNPNSLPRQVRNADAFQLARFPVTCAEYIAFLNTLFRSDPEEAKRRVPRESEDSGHYWPLDPERGFQLPTSAWLAEAGDAAKGDARRLTNAPADWEEDWPVYGVSWDDAMAYAAWFSEKTSFLVCLPHDAMWEKASRGADGRIYPWGHHLDPTFTNNLQANPDGSRPAPVDSFPTDESPYGVRGLCGNVVDWCLNETEEDARRHLRGGSWLDAGVYLRSTFMGASSSAYVYQAGFRLAWIPALPLRGGPVTEGAGQARGRSEQGGAR
ncbi:MAG: protein kinase domain-containing protein [Planctomycetota bacterium]|jgi:serine/threonine protein kinase/formylglycine-generating enzyme required for sulfatase activity